MIHDVLLIGGPEDGRLIHVEIDGGPGVLQFPVRNQEPVDFNKQPNVFSQSFEMCYYTIQQLQCGRGYWFIANHEDMAPEYAIEKLLSAYQK